MTDYGASGPDIRLSDGERDEAVARLNANQREGRLSEAEFTTRAAAVRSAVTRGDLGSIFSDLPSAHSEPVSKASQEPYRDADPSAGAGSYRGWGGWGFGSPGSRIAYSVMPVVALVLFFLTGAFVGWTWAWLWFLIVPVTGAVLYAVNSGRNSSR